VPGTLDAFPLSDARVVSGVCDVLLLLATKTPDPGEGVLASIRSRESRKRSRKCVGQDVWAARCLLFIPVYSVTALGHRNRHVLHHPCFGFFKLHPNQSEGGNNCRFRRLRYLTEAPTSRFCLGPRNPRNLRRKKPSPPHRYSNHHKILSETDFMRQPFAFDSATEQIRANHKKQPPAT
jgi:hypothetical protein